MSDLLRMSIADLHHDGYYRATVRLGHLSIPVDRKFGSWRQTPDDEAGSYREVTHGLAAELQRHVKRLERRARR